jgi:septum site-determining protein MinC
MDKSVISIFLKKENILLKIKDNSTKAQIIDELKHKLPELKKFYKEEQTPILVTGKMLKTAEIDEIQALIESEMKVKVNFDSPRTMGLHGIIKDFRKEIATSETKFYKGSLRSGQRIEFEGSVVIIGDVNDGAEIIAEDNIVVLGALRGMAHAGAKGNEQAIITARIIDSLQIRIGSIIKERTREEISVQAFSYAFVNDKNEIEFE